ncbi:MAG: 4-phosphopantoate--beta-alanine ligase [Thermoplasmatota archaeon]
MTVPESHPRYLSLTTRDRLVDGWKEGLVVTQGLIAHGRGEAFDYLLGETTTVHADAAERAAAALLILADRPVISVNGNVGALSSDDVRILSDLLNCPVEVNIFHRTEDRVGRLADKLEEAGCRRVLGRDPDANIPGLDHARALCEREGIFSSDVILVPLEDGDRCKALRGMGKTVITIDLNPLSRTSRTANITIVDNIIRAIPVIIRYVREYREGMKNGELRREDLEAVSASYDNEAGLRSTLRDMVERYSAGEMASNGPLGEG